jgi:hypothetical protein
MAKGKRHTHVQILSLLRQIEIEPISLMRDSARAQPPMHSPTMEHEPLGREGGISCTWPPSDSCSERDGMPLSEKPVYRPLVTNERLKV